MYAPVWMLLKSSQSNRSGKSVYVFTYNRIIRIVICASEKSLKYVASNIVKYNNINKIIYQLFNDGKTGILKIDNLISFKKRIKNGISRLYKKFYFIGIKIYVVLFNMANVLI